MILRNIYKQLGMEPKYEEEIAKLNNRIILMLDNFRLKFYESNYLNDEIYPTLVKEFAFLVCESNIYRDGPGGRYYLPLKDFFKSNKEKDAFQTNIKILTILLEASKKVLSRTAYENLYKFCFKGSKKSY